MNEDILEDILLEGSTSLDFDGSAGLSVAMDAVNIQLDASRWFSSEIKSIEKSADRGLVLQHRYYCLAGITFASFSIDANINGIFQKAFDEDKRIKQKKGEEQEVEIDNRVKDMAVSWGKDTFKRSSWMNKHKKAFRICRDFEEYKKAVEDSNQYNDAKELMYLRNSLVHMTRESDSVSPFESKVLGLMRDRNLGHNPFIKDDEVSQFTVELLSHDLVEWSIKTAIEFINFYNIQLGIPDKIKSKSR